MPVTVVVGGQFGSEGKGKVAYELARQKKIAAVVRVGGSNSGHTIVDPRGNERKFRALPTASIIPNMVSVIAAGSYVDPEILLGEIRNTKARVEQVIIDPNAVIITDGNKKNEIDGSLGALIGSTQSGTGAAVMKRIERSDGVLFAKDVEALKPYIKETRPFMRKLLERGERILIEGTQGFGLSVLHADCYPYVTSRDTTAAGFVSEAGLSPLDIDEVVMVIRAFPIRVAGNSGPLPKEIDWATVGRESGYDEPLTERTTVTNKIRRVARFDAAVVKSAIEVNNPTCIVLNHVDYVDSSCRKSHAITPMASDFVLKLEEVISRQVDFLGFGPSGMVSREGVVEFARFSQA